MAWKPIVKTPDGRIARLPNPGDRWVVTEDGWLSAGGFFGLAPDLIAETFPAPTPFGGDISKVLARYPWLIPLWWPSLDTATIAPRVHANYLGRDVYEAAAGDHPVLLDRAQFDAIDRLVPAGSTLWLCARSASDEPLSTQSGDVWPGPVVWCDDDEIVAFLMTVTYRPIRATEEAA